MPTSAAGSNLVSRLITPCTTPPPGGKARPGGSGIGAGDRHKGFTLLELLVVVAIIAIASAGVAFALRDTSQTLLERDAARLAALFESARAQSRGTGVPVRWRPTPEGFIFDGLPARTLPDRWLGSDTLARTSTPVLLGPEPVIGRQEVVLQSVSQPSQALRIATDGARPFTVQAATP